ncbi:hypothetical protein GUJ93_ZPchr0002g24600 [Zizania palustris]|uniref:Uncharacterized protein n=1 Tax=Zizania palustris TaxID=103762 RepID=A0A8J5SDI5_ZIZPA|nr:hypothetical protein GUJ93_ZPchr0002g24600 [Zizania palustris]
MPTYAAMTKTHVAPSSFTVEYEIFVPSGEESIGDTQQNQASPATPRAPSASPTPVSAKPMAPVFVSPPSSESHDSKGAPILYRKYQEILDNTEPHELEYSGLCLVAAEEPASGSRRRGLRRVGLRAAGGYGGSGGGGLRAAGGLRAGGTPGGGGVKRAGDGRRATGGCIGEQGYDEYSFGNKNDKDDVRGSRRRGLRRVGLRAAGGYGGSGGGGLRAAGGLRAGGAPGSGGAKRAGDGLRATGGCIGEQGYDEYNFGNKNDKDGPTLSKLGSNSTANLRRQGGYERVGFQVAMSGGEREGGWGAPLEHKATMSTSSRTRTTRTGRRCPRLQAGVQLDGAALA